MQIQFIIFSLCGLGVFCQNFTPIPTFSDHIALNYLRWKIPVEEPDVQNSSKIFELCRSFIVEFGKQASQFIECSIDNARPFRFCEGCVEFYEKTTTIYKDIQRDDEHMSDCRRLLLSSDRVQIIQSVYRDINDIWEAADCDRCFDWVSEDNNGTVTYALKDTTKEFVLLYANFTKCIPEREALNESVCVKCSRFYTDMNSMFIHKLLIDPDSPHAVCMDIVDMMNYTRLMWGEVLNCTNVHRELAPIISIASIVLLVPVVFYVSLRVYGDRKTQQLMLQKRFSPYRPARSSDTPYRPTQSSDSSQSQRPSQDIDSDVMDRRLPPSLYSLNGSNGSINSCELSTHSPVTEITHRTNVGDGDSL